MAEKQKKELPSKDSSQYSFIALEDVEYFDLAEIDENESNNKALKVRFCIVPTKQLRILEAEENARYMTADTMRTLASNLAKDDALTSIVTVYPEKDSKKLAVVSGNHRVQAAIQAGQKEIPVFIIQSRINEDRRKAIQLSHNAITGQDDQNILKNIYESLSLEHKAYSGITDDYFKDINKLDIDGLSIGSVPYEEITIMFLPAEKQVFIDQLLKIEKASSKKTKIFAEYEDYDRIFDAIVGVKQVKEVYNNAVAIRLLADLAQERIEQLREEKKLTEQDKDNGK